MWSWSSSLIQIWLLTEILMGLAVLMQAIENLRARAFWQCLFANQKLHQLFWFQLFAALFLITIDGGVLFGFDQLIVDGHVGGESLSLLRVFLLLILLKVTVGVPVLLRGPVNGGSDSMTALMLLSLVVAAIWPTQKILSGALWFIAIQATLSYVIAGYVKIKEPSWRNGQALKVFLSRQTVYQSTGHIFNASSFQFLLRLVSALILFFELSFFVVFLVPTVVSIYLLVGILFHLLNVYVFGLNRFFWIWLATYPAIYYLAKH